MDNVPFMIVCEEVYNYAPKNEGAEYASFKKQIERIAKESRKYGIGLMVVSLRPSEVSDTIFTQCNNFIALRITNTSDQSYIKNLLPNNTSAVADIFPTLQTVSCYRGLKLNTICCSDGKAISRSAIKKCQCL